MIPDSHSMPKRFWEVYGLTLLFVGVTVYAATNDLGWLLALPAAVSAWGIFVSAMTFYRLGMAAAFRDTPEWAETAQRDMLEGTTDLEEIVSRLEHPVQHFEGPS